VLTPALVHFCHFLWSETLGAALIALHFWFLDRFDRSKRFVFVGLAGFSLGLNALTRETWLYFSLFVAVWLAAQLDWKWRRALPCVALFVVTVAIAVLPWTIRNYTATDRFVLISTNHWFPIALGNIYPSDTWFLGTKLDRERGYVSGESMVRQARVAAPGFRDEFEREQYWKRVALDAIAAEQPWWIFKKAVRNTARLYYARTEELRFLGSEWVQPGRMSAYALIVTDVVGSLTVMILGILGLWLVRGHPLRLLAVLAILYVTSSHVIANTVPRFHVPLLPLFVLYIGPLLAGGMGREKVERWRWVGVAFFFAAFVLLPLPLTLRFLEVVWSRAGMLGG
jgi:hypothetical protein